MASVSSLSSSSSIYGSRTSNIISGLASGLDTESMIEGMVQGIKSKIDKQKQQQTLLGWQQQAYRSISDQLVQLSSKYTSYTSSTNLMSEAFFSPSIITAMGKYADSISASGTTDSNIEVLGVTNLAENESVTFTGLAGYTPSNSIVGDIGLDGKVDNDNIDLSGKASVSNITGKYILFEYNNKDYEIQFDSNKDYNTIDDVVADINSQLEEQLGAKDVITAEKVVSEDGKSTTIKLSYGENGNSSAIFEITGGSKDALKALGLKDGDKITNNKDLVSGKVTDEGLYSETTVEDIIVGSSITMTYNGIKKTIQLPDQATYDEITKDPNTAGKKFAEYLQEQVNDAFGVGRITIDNKATDDKNFKLGITVNGANDNGLAPSFSIDSASVGLLGSKGILGIDYGTSNRIDTSKTLGDLYDKNKDGKLDINGLNSEVKDGKTYYRFNMNGVEIGEYTADTTLETIMNDINESKAGVKITYSETSNQFMMEATHSGAGGQVRISKGSESRNLAAFIFGSVSAEGTVSRVDEDGNFQNAEGEVKYTAGEDATMTAMVNGFEMDFTSDTNKFDIAGLSLTVNGEFKVEGNETGVKFNQEVDTDKIVDTIKTFVEDYNKMLEDLGKAYTTQPEKGYEPLTDDQKAEMTEKQIEEYENKAKEGLLFADSDLKSLASELRFLFSSSEFSKIGITTSSTASDRGKLSIDEEKLRAAIEGDLETVKDIFTSEIEKDKDGNIIGGGAMQKLKGVLDKYAATTGATKGILIEKAGSQYSPTALLNNTIKSQIEDIDERIDKLTDQLNNKIDLYTSKFTQLEMLISQMNSQSSYLSSLSGGY